MVASEGCEIEVTQRLKQTRTIIDKLLRYPNMHLATMQDIGGCRAVLNSIGEIRRVERRLARNRPPVGYRDYVAEPKLSGYRGVHVVVEYDGRMIEVQLRTRVMHEWAFTVERLGGRIGADLKSSRGPKEVLDLLGVISEAMAIEESGGTVEPILLERVRALRAVAEPFLRGGAG